ncbi:N-acetylmuramoyl-L-alanine amidase LytC precursor [archaeon]|nr:N-acetylmuramoyl-L-alanine amidase LytC precursor [archaeon]
MIKKFGILLVLLLALATVWAAPGNTVNATPILVAAHVNPVILVSNNPADQTIAQLLSGRINASIISTPWGTLSNETVAKVEQSGASIVYVIGGTVAVPEIASRINITVKRMGGKNRFATAAMVAEMWNSSKKAIIVQGYDDMGIKEAMQEAKKMNVPILFVRRNEVPAMVQSIIKKMHFEGTIIVPSPDMEQTRIENMLSTYGVKKVNITKVNFTERALTVLNKAEESINETSALLGENITSGRQLAAEKLISDANNSLEMAKSAYANNSYGIAFGLATAARVEANSAKMILRHVFVGAYKEDVNGAEAEIKTYGIREAKHRMNEELKVLKRRNEMFKHAFERQKEMMTGAIEQREKTFERQSKNASINMSNQMKKAFERQEKILKKKVNRIEERAKAGRQVDGNQTKKMEKEMQKEMQSKMMSGKGM